MTGVYEVLHRPIVTEKSNYLSSKLGQYVFEVTTEATKAEIKEIFLHVATYCGAPAALDSFRIAKKVLAETRT